MCVCVCVCETCYISAPESNSHIKKRSYTVWDLVLQEVFQSVHHAVVYWLRLCSGQSSEEFLLACYGECLDLVQWVASFN